MIVKTCEAWPVSIFIAGDYDSARQICQTFCDDVGMCVTLSRTTYIYTDGEEPGVIVGLINYARFPSLPQDIENTALSLAEILKDGLGQQSFTIQTPSRSTFYSWREEE